MYLKLKCPAIFVVGIYVACLSYYSVSSLSFPSSGTHGNSTTPVQCGKFDATNIGNDNINNLPWFASVLKNDGDELMNLCSAVVVSPRAVISAAHCFWDHSKNQLQSTNKYRVVVGKYNHWRSEKPSGPEQTLQVEKVYIPSRFRGIARMMADDISVLILNSSIQFNNFIYPVCIDFMQAYTPFLTPGRIGMAAGWVGKINAHELKVFNLDIVDFFECENNIPRDFQAYLTYDKICAGDLNRTTICIGDSGTALSQQFRNGRWYLIGVASVGVNPERDQRCELRYYHAFTRLSIHLDFIKEKLRLHNEYAAIPSDSAAVLCNNGEFQCNSSGCINNKQLCDGKKHCSDGSDETLDKCHNRRCPSSSFQCNYGACIERKNICNGIMNCVDGSDEDADVCEQINANSCPYKSSGCIIPKQPENGLYHVIGCVNQRQNLQETHFPSGVLLNYSCNPGYTLSGPSLIACVYNWSSPLPSCIPVTCPLLRHSSRDVTYFLNGHEINIEGNSVTPGTQASVYCKYHYESIPGFETYDILCEANGKWNRELQPCIPKCGVPNPGGLPLVGFGFTSPMGLFPWHIGLYKDKGNGIIFPFCGGSLVSSRVIISAAHCFREPGGTVSKNFYIVAGKYYFDWNNKTEYVQHLQMRDLILPKLYKGPGRSYSNDIAVIILVRDVQINEAVRPVCVDYESTFLKYFSPRNTVGNVTGWGLNENQTQNEVLHTVNLPYVDVEDCERNTPVSFSSLLTNDKFCAGNINKTSVCRGDSGGGYTVRFRNGRWYLVGIVSIGPSEECALYPYATFTNVFHHLNFIRQHVFKYI